MIRPFNAVTAGLAILCFFSATGQAEAQANGSSATIPMQVRLAYAGSTGMMVSWNTYSKLPNPTVSYGLTPSLNLSASSNVSVTYNTSTTYNNHVKITGLKPGTLYYYQPQYSNVSTPYTFQTSMAAGDATPFSIAVVVDLGVMGTGGLSTTVGAGAHSPLTPGENNTIQSLAAVSDYSFLWHRKSYTTLLRLCY
jgi:hypothetical protein